MNESDRSDPIDSGKSKHTRIIRGIAEVNPDWLKVYLITDRKLLPENLLLSSIEAALKGGIRDIQLREKDLLLPDLFSLAMELRQMTKRYKARLYINDRLDIALMVDADGVHLPESGLPPNEVKGRYPHLLVGVSTHSIESAKRARENGADFITFSPIYETPSKQAFGSPQGLKKLRETVQEVDLPVIALGGINIDRIPEIRKQGAFGVALIRGIWTSSNIEKESAKYIQLIKENPNEYA